MARAAAVRVALQALADCPVSSDRARRSSCFSQAAVAAAAAVRARGDSTGASTSLCFCQDLLSPAAAARQTLETIQGVVDELNLVVLVVVLMVVLSTTAKHEAGGVCQSRPLGSRRFVVAAVGAGGV